MPFHLQGVDPDVFKYVAHATRQPKHEFQRLMISDHHLAKKGAGAIATIGRVIADGAETVAGHAASLINAAANFARTHATTIENAAHVANIASGLATMAGLIDPSTAARVHSGASLLKKKPKAKEGGAWIDFV